MPKIPMMQINSSYVISIAKGVHESSNINSYKKKYH